MTPEQFRQVEALFHRGKGLPPDEQRALLDAECGDDAEVRAEVEKLLAQADPDETLADLKGRVNRVLRPGVNDPSAATAGPVIEGYEILREIHRGGQGVVYQAIQKSTKRKVAIKVLLEGPYASKSARRRFEREIELVAQLKHPNIIGIFHSGQTSDGRQYCVMDYVRGVPLDQYVRNEKLTLEDALRLFAKVCEAVNYAHQKGVIHRDLKPSNILVTPPLTKGGPGGVESGTVGDPKVLDFGLAKQLISREASLISLTGQVVGTLPYMSPEQAEGNPDKIDIRTDVYALGVILYQMLTGHYPYPVAGQMAEVLKHIAETEPTPPTRSWKSGSGVTKRAHKRIRPGQCPIDDEVQTIILRTLSKERERRYQSAGELAKDVAHYLADEPIDAKRDSAFYVIRKQLRRYKRQALTGLVVVLILALAAVMVIHFQNEADRVKIAARAKDEKRREEKRVEQNKILKIQFERKKHQVEGLLDKARIYASIGQYQKARDLSQQAVGINPENIPAHILLARTGPSLLPPEQVIKETKTILNAELHLSESEQGQLHVLLASSYAYNGNRELSEQHMAKAESLIPQSAVLYVAQSLSGIDPAVRISDINKALKIDQNCFEALLLKARWNMDYGDLDTAIKNAEIAADLRPNDLRAKIVWSQCMFLRGNVWRAFEKMHSVVNKERWYTKDQEFLPSLVSTIMVSITDHHSPLIPDIAYPVAISSDTVDHRIVILNTYIGKHPDDRLAYIHRSTLHGAEIWSNVVDRV